VDWCGEGPEGGSRRGSPVGSRRWRCAGRRDVDGCQIVAAGRRTGEGAATKAVLGVRSATWASSVTTTVAGPGRPALPCRTSAARPGRVCARRTCRVGQDTTTMEVNRWESTVSRSEATSAVPTDALTLRRAGPNSRGQRPAGRRRRRGRGTGTCTATRRGVSCSPSPNSLRRWRPEASPRWPRRCSSPAASAADQAPQHLPGVGHLDDVAQRHH
jgi:hypothetical protein